MYQFAVTQNLIELAVTFKDQGPSINTEPFILIVNSVMRITSSSRILYYKSNFQVAEVDLEDGSENILLSKVSASLSLSTAIPEPVRTYSCSYVNSLGEVIFTMPISNSDKLTKQTLGEYPAINYYTLECPFPYAQTSAGIVGLFVVQNYILNGAEYDFTSNRVELQVEAQPVIVTILPSDFYALNTAGSLTIEGSGFDPTKSMYLRLTYKDSLLVTVITASSLTSTSAMFQIEPSFVPYVGAYNIEISHHADVF